ncbi:MAG: hypothetical protein DRP78_07115, partial [Candidatus Omnitrophota bacterium]
FSSGDTFSIVDRIYDEQSYTSANVNLSVSGGTGGRITWKDSGTVVLDANNELAYNIFSTASLDRVKVSDSLKLLNFSTSAYGGESSDSQTGGYYLWGTSGALTSPTVTHASYAAGAASNTTIAFTTVNAVPVNGDVQVTFGSGFDISSAAYVSGNTGASVSVNSQVLTINLGTQVSAAEAVSIVISGIINPAVTGSTGTYAIETQDAEDIAIDTGTASANTITVGALSSTNVEPASLAAGASGNVTVSFTTANPIPATGKIVVTFPTSLDSGFSFNSGGTSAATSATMDGTLSVGIASNVITLTRSGGAEQAAGAETITLTYIKNPALTGSTGAYQIKTTNASNADIDEDSSVGADTITTGSLTSPTVTHASYLAGATSNTTIAFTTANAVEQNGDVQVTFGSGFDISGADYVSGNTGSTVSVSPQVLTINLGTALTASEAVSIVVSGITNPASLGTTGSYAIETQNASDIEIDSGIADANYIIPEFAITAPNGSEEWTANTTHNITWNTTTGTVAAVNLFYSADSGSNWQIIETSVTNSGSYAWKTPFVSSNAGTCRVKIESSAGSEGIASDTSDADFSILIPVITVTSPNAGTEQWVVGSQESVTWTAPASVTYVNLEYSSDNGTIWKDMSGNAGAKTTVANSGSYTWTIPEDVSRDVLIRASDGTKVSLTITGTAAAKVAGTGSFEDSNKTLVLDVLSDFIVGDSVTVSGIDFTNFSASEADYLNLEIYNTGYMNTADDKTIKVYDRGTDFQYFGSTGDGWHSAESNEL